MPENIKIFPICSIFCYVPEDMSRTVTDIAFCISILFFGQGEGMY